MRRVAELPDRGGRVAKQAQRGKQLAGEKAGRAGGKNKSGGEKRFERPWGGRADPEAQRGGKNLRTTGRGRRMGNQSGIKVSQNGIKGGQKELY